MLTPRLTTDLKLAPCGVADAYVVLPLGRFSSEAKALANLRLDQRSEPAEILYLTGQADLRARFRLDDFRNVVRTQYPVEQSAARVFNWIFSVPFEGRGDRVINRGLRFAVHLRVDRVVYGAGTALTETAVVRYLEERLREAGCTAEILAGLGWADIIVDGSFTPDAVSKFVGFLFDVSEAKIDCKPKPRPVFIRMLTLLGYRWNADGPEQQIPLLDDWKPVMFVRATPGRLREAVESMERIVGTSVATRLIDGRSDFVLICEEPARRILSRLLSLDEPAERDIGRPVHAIETHLLFGLSPREERAVNTIVFATDEKLRRECNCRNPRMSAGPLSGHVPQELRQPIAHVCFLFRNVVRDDVSCCDVSAAVRGAALGLDRLGKQMRQLHRRRSLLEQRLKPTASDPVLIEDHLMFVHSGIEAQQHVMELWYLLSDRMLRQRTTGSYDELFLQSDQAVVYRGSVQKFLYLADHLMNDFARKVSGRSLPALFGALYDAVGRISSLRGSGLVRIPVRHLFTLPDVIPDLWHEVGVYLFHDSVKRKTFGLGISDADQQTYQLLGDYYGDMVVFRFGFAGDWRRFVISMTRGWIDSVPYAAAPAFVQRQSFAELLARLAFVREVDRRVTTDVFRIQTVPFDFSAAKYRALKLHAYLRATFRPRPPRTEPRIPAGDEDMFASAAFREHALVDRFAETLARVFERTVAATIDDKSQRERCAEWLDSYDGTIVEFDGETDLNAVFGELYWTLRRYWMTDKQGTEFRTQAFQKMAGLSKSAVIEYHRRQVIAPPSAARAS